jgi:hypothetical protein
MSDIIILPGTHRELESTHERPDFEALAAKTSPAKKLIVLPGEEDVPEAPALPQTPQALIGRTLTYNPKKIRFFQTFHFYVGARHPFTTVTPDADLRDLFNAVLDGRLIDATEQHKSGLVGDGAEMSPVDTVDEPDMPRVFLGVQKGDKPTDGALPLYVAVPESKEQEEQFLSELKQKGRIDGTYKPVNSGISLGPVMVSDIEPERPPQYEPGFWNLIGQAFGQLFRKIFHRK